MIWDVEMRVTDRICQDAHVHGGHEGAGKTQTQWAAHACMGQKTTTQTNTTKHNTHTTTPHTT